MHISLCSSFISKRETCISRQVNRDSHLVKETDNKTPFLKSFPEFRKDFKKGVYKIHFTKTYYGKLRFSKEMPGFFVQDPALALEVIPDEQKLKEHRKKFNS